MISKNKVAIVTGAAKNIGRSISIELAKLNFNLVIHANSDIEGAEKTLSMVKKQGVEAFIEIGDLTDNDFTKKIVEKSKNMGNLAVLINNASQRNFVKFEDMSYEDWRKVMRINVDAVFMMCKNVVPEMKKNAWGRIVNLGGLSAHIGAIGRAHVITSKLAIVGLTRALATEFAQTGITINCVVPGMIDTIRGPSAGQGLIHPSHSTPPIGRKGYPLEIAQMVKNLCSENTEFITGQTFHVNGGSFYS